MHAPHGVGHAVGGGTGRHVVRVQGTAGAAARSHREVLLALFEALLLVGAGHRVLEARGVGGVAGDRNVHALKMQDGHTLAHVVGAVTAHLGALAVRIGGFLDDFQLAAGVVELGLDVGKAVDATDDLSGVLAQTVQNHAQGFLAGLVGALGQADGALGRGKALVAGQEGEASGLFTQQHGCQVAVADADLAVVGHRTRNAEGLQALAQGLGDVGGALLAALDRDRGTHHIGPGGVFEADRLDLLGDGVGIDALGLADLLGLLDGSDAIGVQQSADLLDSSLVTFE
ncbi:MAG: hypothetical protein BWY87_01348 [Deltaproteobacteria bacterium ADurb.Bin510]|nr:MAG: hypothetical protein BWY87_01348 [Deltaproteobacteria bacterium ADurb.Bin510]